MEQRLIDANRLKEEFVKMFDVYSDECTMITLDDCLISAIQLVEEQPTVKPIKGKWIDNRFVSNEKECGCCGKTASIDGIDFNYKFCPYCGADMRGGKGR